MGLYDRIANERRGEESLLNKMAEERGNQIAQRKLEDVAIQNMERERNATLQAERDNQVLNQGRAEGQVMEQERLGLGMGSQTAQSIGQQDQMREQSMNDAAMQIIQEIEGAQAQGASEEELGKMIQSIPPELQGPIKQIQGQRKAEMDAQQPQPSEQIQPAGSGITEYARNLLQ